MAWTEQDYQEIVARLMAESIGVNEVPDAGSTDNISSLPAYQPASGTEVPTVVKASLELLVAPALEAADKANEAADKAESNATAAQTAANTANEKAELAAQAASDVNAAKEGAETAAQSANTAASNANKKAVLADTAAANANDTAEHPTYIGQDHYVYKWNKTAQAYDKTDIYTKGDAFSIKKVYASVANMEADKSNPDITEGDFVLVNTGDVEDPDNAKLYVKADGDFEFLVDMSGTIGFTGKTPQFSMGTISTLEAGAAATATISEDGVDSDGNPKYKINFAIPRGNPGAPFRVTGEYATLEALKSAVPDGSAVDGFMAVGTEAPYDYYAWVNGDWVNQGKIAGGGSGNVVIVPIMGLTTQSTSDEIFNAFGGKQNLIDIIKKVKDEDCVVIAKTDDDPNAVVQQTFSVVNATYVNDNNLILGLISWSVNVTSQIIIQVIDGVASYNEISTPLMTEAPSNGNAYGRKNKGWVEVPEKSDVLTKTNTSPFTPTKPYHPATKKYVDEQMFLLTISNTGLQELISNQETTDETTSKINTVFGSIDNFSNVVSQLIANKRLVIEISEVERIQLGSIYAYANLSTGNYMLSFDLNYSSFTLSGVDLLSKRIFISLNDLYGYYFIVRDIVTSDNLTTITKKTAAEYEALGSKDANTAYCVTD